MWQEGEAAVERAMEVRCGLNETERNRIRLWMREKDGPSKEAHM